MRAHARSWLRDGTHASKLKLARIRDLEAKEDLVIEYAIAWRKRTISTEELEIAIDDLVRCRSRATRTEEP
jgi:hypothetical protein